MSAYDDLHDERFGKSTWFAKPQPEPINFPLAALLVTAEKDDPLTIARRRKELLDELADDVTEEESA